MHFEAERENVLLHIASTVEITIEFKSCLDHTAQLQQPRSLRDGNVGTTSTLLQSEENNAGERVRPGIGRVKTYFRSGSYQL